MHIVGRQREDEAVLAGVDDGGGLSRQLLRADKILNVLRDDDLHTVVFTDTLCHLEHEVQCQWILRIDKNVGLVDDDNDLAVRIVTHIVLAVLDDLVVKIFEYHQHLRVRNRVVPIRQQRLEVEHNEVLFGGKRGWAVPDRIVAAARGEF